MEDFAEMVKKQLAIHTAVEASGDYPSTRLLEELEDGTENIVAAANAMERRSEPGTRSGNEAP